MPDDPPSSPTPLVSVVIPAYGRPDYLRLAIQGVLDQSVPDWELIVLDDSSPTSLAPVVEAFHDPRVQFHRNRDNLGVCANTRRAISLARGKFLVVLNDDDTWGPHFLERMLPILDDDGIVVAFCNFHIIDADGVVNDAGSVEATRHFGRDRLPPGRYFPHIGSNLVQGNVPAVMCAVFRRDDIDWSQLPDGAGSSYDLWMTYLACMTYKAYYYVPERLTFYRTHRQQQTHTRTLQHHQGLAYCYECFTSDPRLAEFRKLFRDAQADELAGCGTALLRMGRPNEARAHLRRSLAIAPAPRAAIAYAVTLLPSPAARAATDWVAECKAKLVGALRSRLPRPRPGAAAR